MSGDHRGVIWRTGGHGGTGGGQGTGGGHAVPGSGHGGGPAHDDHGAAHETRPTRRDDHRRGQRPPRRHSRTGSHRMVREHKPRRRLGMLVAGMVAGAGVCAVAAFAVLSGVEASRQRDVGQVVGSGAAERSPMSRAERSIVPDACELLDKRVADRLAPGADRTQADNYQSGDRQNQCVWGAYTGDRKRQLTVELRALDGTGGKTPTDTATAAFESERKADESGKALLAGQELTEKTSLNGVGNEGYVVYSVDEDQGAGEAIANVRVTNVLVTVHYSGGNGGEPLGSTDAMNGATEAARDVVEALNAT